ncbi:MAG: HyaD/HybD family hydrogenase maturation endopeptidase [Sideroxyarcus sp.]|nr:HyaD/HybD family hydrogenase maturation endopeptidase [Sideroxyarcus sp.]
MTNKKDMVLGIGNPQFADDGFGVRAVHELHRLWRFSDQVELVDGGTQGFLLLSHVLSARRLIVFDVVDNGLEPGTLLVLENEQVPRLMLDKKLSLHQSGLQDALIVAALTGNFPERLVLVGVQPAHIAAEGRMSEAVTARISRAVQIALSHLEHWGNAAELRNENANSPEAFLTADLMAAGAGSVCTWQAVAC